MDAARCIPFPGEKRWYAVLEWGDLPYGDELSSVGTGAISYGYTGQWTDPSGLIYLRARYYAPWDGRFMSRDPWDGDYNRPMSYNQWLYGYANPIMFTDPSGMIPIPDVPCDILPPELAKICREYYESCGGFGDIPRTCPTEIPQVNHDVEGRSDVFIGLLRGCPGWWHDKYNMDDDTDVMKLALTFAFKWETSNSNIHPGGKTYMEMAEAMAHKVWQGEKDEYVKYSGFDWFLGGRESMCRRIQNHYDANFGRCGPATRDPKPFIDPVNDLDLDYEFMTARALAVHNVYYGDGEAAFEAPNRPYDWANPDADSKYKTWLLGKKEGPCPHHIFAIHGSGTGKSDSGDDCIYSYDQWLCLSEKKGDNCIHNTFFDDYPEITAAILCDSYKYKYPNYP